MSTAVLARAEWSRLRELGILRVAGADARVFLQGQLSNDIERLTRERTLLSALNTVQGRVVAILHLAQRADGIIAILPTELIAPVIERLRKYVLRSKVTLSDDSSRLAVAGLLDAQVPSAISAPPDPRAIIAGHVPNDEISVHAQPGPASRYLLVGPEVELAAVAAEIATPAATSDHWRLAAIECGEPQVYRETSDLFVAQMLNLDLVDGLSFSKGCYTGQEIIARTQHRGRIKRRTLRYRVHGPERLAPGESVGLEGRVGRVVEFAVRSASESEVLAVVPLDESSRAEQGAVRNVSAERLPLPYSIPDLA